MTDNHGAWQADIAPAGEVCAGRSIHSPRRPIRKRAYFGASFCRKTPKALMNHTLSVSLDMYVCIVTHIHDAYRQDED